MADVPSVRDIIIYADDDQDDIDLVRDAFDQHASTIDLITFSNGAQVLQYLNDLSIGEPLPCLIILDVNMPGIDGREVLKEIRNTQRFKHLPVVMFSTSNAPLDIEFASQYDAGFITKPLNLAEMELIKEQFIDHCSVELQNKIRKKISR
jgi:CheY-like chemotaxis protein